MPPLLLSLLNILLQTPFRRRTLLLSVTVPILLHSTATSGFPSPAQSISHPDFTVELETLIRHYNVPNERFLWFHPRAAAIPATDAGDSPQIILTLQKHLEVSDYYSGLHFMTRSTPQGIWSGPFLPPALDWTQLSNGITLSVADVTPGWHPPSRQIIAIGCQVRYSPKGSQLDDVPRAHQTVYAAYNPASQKWSPWKQLLLPEIPEFNFARNACSQWLVLSNGHLLVPLYIGTNSNDRYSTTVAECAFDGSTLSYLRHGNILKLPVARGLYEPSLIEFQGRYYLTLRNDLRGYVSSSPNGLQFDDPIPWLFDDGTELGSYNTQQHWLSHRDALYLVYTRRGANNDHIVRHRAPLFMARVQPSNLRVIRSSEVIVVPERGAELGNFGCNRVNDTESWITVSEGMFMKDSVQRGAQGATFVARILWK